MPLRWSYPHATSFWFALLSACTNEPAASSVPETQPALLDGDTSPGTAPDAPAFLELISADWELPPGTEQYVCARLTLTDTMFVGNWSSDSPLGTHHVLLTVSPQGDGEPDGVAECDAATLGPQMVFGAGVGSRDQRLPAGVAMKLVGGAQVILNLHLFNPTDKPLRGHSGARIQPIDEKDVRDVADVAQVSALKLVVPPGRSTSYGKCTLDRDVTLFRVGPHMHQTGVAMTAVAHTAQHGDVMLFDGPYSFEDQQTYPVGPLQLKAGDSVDVACTYDNLSDQTLHFGSSSNDEMCQFALLRYPAGGPSLCAK